MMQPATSFPDATKDEYLTDRIHRAAEIIWLAVCFETGRESDDLVPDGWFEQTEARLARVLYGDGFHEDPDGVPFYVYWRALEILNVQRAYASSSRRVEQAAPPETADIDEYADEQRRASVGG